MIEACHVQRLQLQNILAKNHQDVREESIFLYPLTHLVVFEQQQTKALLTAQQPALFLAFCFGKPVIYSVCTDRMVFFFPDNKYTK